MAKAKTAEGNLNFIYRPKSDAQKDAEDLWRRSRILFFLGPAGTGKAQKLDSIVWTPDGPMLMGDVKVGQTVCTPDGGSAPVVGVYPQGKKTVYEIEFDNGDKVHCCEDHLWQVERCNTTKPVVLSLKQMLDEGIVYKGKRKTFAVRPPRPLHFKTQPVPFDAYALGLLLGDGCLRASPIKFTTTDLELLRAITECLPDGLYAAPDGDIDYRFTAGQRGGQKNPLTEVIRSLGLWRTSSGTKFIPDVYKYNTVDVRLAILQGLLDTDGHCTRSSRRPGEPNCSIEYVSTSSRLINDVKEVVESLGGVATVAEKLTTCRYKGEVVVGLAYRMHLSLPAGLEPFRLHRKRIKYRPRLTPKRRWIASVTAVGEEECQCIAIDHPDHLYVTDHCIPTHNTTAALGMAIKDAFQSADKTERRKKLWLARPHVAAGEEYGHLPGTLPEKLGVWCAPFYDCFESLSDSNWSKLEKVLDVETVGIGLIQGRTIRNGTLLVDECQELTPTQIKCICTRLGENSRIVFTGDPDQSNRYDPKKCPIVDAARKLDKLDTVSLLRFPASQQLRDPLITDILNLL